MKRLLSTKKLSKAQTQLILNAGFSYVEYNAIHIEPLEFNAPKEISKAIFTSQNSVRTVLSKKIQIQECLCVGSKTKALLEENGQKVTKMTENASELGNFIQKSYQNETFYFFSGTIRRDEIPNAIKNSKNSISEIKTYKTTLNLVNFSQNWDGILFFSPSGVQSYFQKNTSHDSEVDIAFCIGETTQSEAKKYTPYTYIANTPTVESVIAKAVKTLKTND